MLSVCANTLLVGGREAGREGFPDTEHWLMRSAGKHLHFDFLIEKEQQARSGQQAHQTVRN